MKYDFTTLPDRHRRTPSPSTGWAPALRPASEGGLRRHPHVGGGHELPHCAHHPQAIIERAQHPASAIFSHATNIRLHHPLAGDAQRRHRPDQECIGYENGVLGGVVSALNILLPRRQCPAPLPHLHRLHPQPGEQRLQHRPQPAGTRRERCLAHGLRGHGKEDRGEHIHAASVLLAPQPLRPRVGALGAGARHGAVQKARCNGRIRRDLVGHHPGGPQAHPHAEHQRRRPQPHRCPLRPLQDLQPGGSYRQLPHHLQPVLRDRVEKEAPCPTTTP